jgi:Flp pilus assembly protein TadB
MSIFGIISLGAAAASGIAGYVGSKDFTQRKLRFVDVVHSPAAPWIAGAVAAVIAAPVVWLLPLVGAGTAVIFGAGVALGVRSAQRDRHLLP